MELLPHLSPAAATQLARTIGNRAFSRELGSTDRPSPALQRQTPATRESRVPIGDDREIVTTGTVSATAVGSSWSIQEGDLVADRTAAAAALRAKLTQTDALADYSRKRAEELRDGNAPDSSVDAAKAERAALLLEQEAAQARGDLLILESGWVDRSMLDAVVQRQALDLDPARRTLRGQESMTSIGSDGLSHSTTRTTSPEDHLTHTDSSRLRVNTSGVTSSQTSTSEQRDEGLGATVEDSRSRATTVSGRGVSHVTQDVNKVTMASGAHASTSRGQTTAATAGDGRLDISHTRRRSVTNTEANGRTTAHTSARSGGGQVVHGSAGSGLGATGSMSSTTQDGATERSSTGSAHGSFTVDVTALGDDRFRVVLTVNAGLALGGSGSVRKDEDHGLGGSGTLGGHMGATLTYVRELGEQTARDYLGDLSAVESGQDRAGRPEYGILARLRAASSTAGGAVGSGFGLLSGDAAQQLAEGESIELDLTAGASAGLDASAKRHGAGAGASVSGAATRGRKVTVARQGEDLVVTVAVRSEERGSAGVTGNYGVASGGASMRRGAGESSTVAFRLDPADAGYDARFGEIVRLPDETSLLAYAAEHSGLVHSSTTAESTSRGQEASLGVGPASMTVGSSQSRTSEVTVRDDALTGTMSGEQTSGGSLSLGSWDLYQSSQSSGATATVRADGELEVDLTRRDRQSDLGRGWREMTDDLDQKRTEDAALEMATSGVGLLQGYLERTYERLSTYRLDRNDVDQLVQRAALGTHWEQAISRLELIQPWRLLRQSLANPTPAADYLEKDPTDDGTFARRLAQAEALADFMAGYGQRGGHSAVVYVLRHWGGRTGNVSTADDLGVLWEWPSGLAGARARYEVATGQLASLDSTLADLDTTDRADGQQRIDDLSQTFQTVREEVAEHEDFEQPRARLEMLKAIDADLRAVTRSGLRWGGVPTAQEAGPLAPGETSILRVEQLDRHLARAQIEGRLRGAVERESRTLAEIRGVMPQEYGGNLSGRWEKMWSQSRSRAADLCHELAAVHEEWISQIGELRSVYETLGVAPQDWRVKPGRQDPRRGLDPKISTLVELYRGVIDMGGMGPAAHGQRRVADQWLARGRY